MTIRDNSKTNEERRTQSRAKVISELGGPEQSSIIRQIAKVLSRFAFIGIIVLAWQIVVVVARIPTIVLPAPTEIAQSLVANWPSLASNSLPTLYETVVGFSVGTLTGVVTAVSVVNSSYLRSTLYPTLVVFNSFPKIAIAPLLIIWFGLGYESRIAVSIFSSFFPVFINSVGGFGRRNANLDDLERTTLASRRQIFVKFRFPASLPSIFDGMKIAMPLAMVGAIVGEFMGGQNGLGVLLIKAEDYLDIPQEFSVILILVVISLLLFYIVVAADKLLLKWRPSRRGR